MNASRRLTLRRESLAPLTGYELGAVAGGSHTCPLSDTCTHGPSLDEACPTVPVVVCARTLNPLSCAVC
jgi:hypothetical protein